MTSTFDKVKNKIKKAIEESEAAPQNVYELDLSEIKIKKFTVQMKKEIEKLKNLEVLNLMECELQTLENFPQLNLTIIDLASNAIKDSQIIWLKKYKHLGQLNLLENNIEKPAAFKHLDSLEQLYKIQLSDNPITQQKEYRKKMFQILPTLQILDNKDQQGNQVYDDDQQFQQAPEGQQQGQGYGQGQGQFQDGDQQEYLEDIKKRSGKAGKAGKATPKTSSASKRKGSQDQDDQDDQDGQDGQNQFEDQQDGEEWDEDQYDSNGDVKYAGSDAQQEEQDDQDADGKSKQSKSKSTTSKSMKKSGKGQQKQKPKAAAKSKGSQPKKSQKSKPKAAQKQQKKKAK